MNLPLVSNRPVAFVFLAITVLTTLSPYSTATCAQGQGLPMRIEVKMMLLEATVWDHEGKTIDTLHKEDFVLLDNGAPQSIAHFSRDALPLAVIVVVDMSGSMAPVMDHLRRAALDALKRLKPEDRVALITFSDKPTIRVALTNNKTRVAVAIKSFSANGGTNIHEALTHAAKYLRTEAPKECRIILLVSDDFAGTHRDGVTSSDVLQSLREADATLYNLKIHNPIELLLPRARAEAMDLIQVPKIAAETGGVSLQINDIRGLSEGFGTLISILKSRYTLGFYLNSKEIDPGYHKLELRLTSSLGDKNRDYTILSRDGYYPASVR